MQALIYSKTETNLKNIIDKVCDDFDEYLITTDDNKSVIIISYDEYNSIKETIYLLSSKNNHDRLNEAIEQIENLQFIKKDLEI
jgi:antitoxin YefM